MSHFLRGCKEEKALTVRNRNHCLKKEREGDKSISYIGLQSISQKYSKNVSSLADIDQCHQTFAASDNGTGDRSCQGFYKAGFRIQARFGSGFGKSI